VTCRPPVYYRPSTLFPKRRNAERDDGSPFAAKVREGIYFVDFIKHLDRAAAVTLLLDLNQGIVTALIGRLLIITKRD
jgi:hypothetical protein